MDPHVFVEITLLGKRLTASIDRTHKGFLLCMRSQMVEEIVPLLEASVTLFMFADKYLSPAFTFGLKIFDIFEGS